MKDFSGRVAVVTGAASGIGRALAERFGAEGMKVVLADVEPMALDEAAAALRANGVETHAVVTDVSQADQVSALAERTLEAFGGVHVVCNNAGVFAGGLAWKTEISDYEWVLGVNTWGVIHGVRTFVPILLEQGEEAHVVNTASMAAVTATPLAAAYNMSKHAVLSLSETLYLELQQQGAPIGVSALCPELIATRIGEAERNRPEHLQRKDGPASPEQELVETAIREFVSRGAPAAVIADRVLDAIRNDRFYVLSDEGDGWREACNVRLEDIRLGRNPTFVTPTT